MSDPRERKFLLEFGSNLAARRKSLDVTQAQFAEKIGISRLSYAYFETGKRWPRPLTLKKIAAGLDVSLADLFENL